MAKIIFKYQTGKSPYVFVIFQENKIRVFKNENQKQQFEKMVA